VCRICAFLQTIRSRNFAHNNAQLLFALSPDTELLETGTSTLPYEEHYNDYSKWLHQGLATENKDVIALFDDWNKRFFPQSATAADEDDEDAEEDDPEQAGGEQGEDDDDDDTGQDAAMRVLREAAAAKRRAEEEEDANQNGDAPTA
jgi:hypothetical protein